MKQLFRLIPTPRAAKRFVNIYRLIRASVTPSELSRFTAANGEYRAVLFLLAIQTGFPSSGTAILEELLEKARPTQAWWPFVDELLKRDRQDTYERERWARLAEQLRILRGFIPDTMPCGAFIKWADDVARYSFESGRLLFKAREGNR